MTFRLPRPCRTPVLAAVLIASLAGPGAPAVRAQGPDASRIVAVVNGDVISRADVDNRRRLFALSTGMPGSPEVLERLVPQVRRMLVDERLRLQEVQRRHVVVQDKEIADAIREIEQRNNMPEGTLRRRLSADGVEFRTLIDQVRVQIGWSRVLRQELGQQAQVSDADVAERERMVQAQTGQEEFRLAEIFVPISDPDQADEARRFADTVIQQLRAGAPFPVVAAQFSQSQSALQGGDEGWVQGSQIDPEVLRILREMPPGAISNPVRVPGGLSIVTLRGKREVGRDMATMVTLRQVFLPFSSRLDPANPTQQQQQTLERAQRLGATAKSCEDMDAANKAAGAARPADPGELRVESVAVPPLRQLLGTLPPGKPSQPLVADDGVAVIMVCTREQRNLGIPTKQELTERIISERVELASRQLMRDLQRRAVIDLRS
ncbi:Survival protein SurA precursor (Peptidyl-prolyl cis-trans isomerase SurA) [Rhodovastum atsumiense]|uniref:Parvulin-like PPIase n=1 Tax=Rhodovastum atsumiense TaxID=504468 RepID=A0A5M6ILF4_9PROT|nr:peptidylprolyl isomerase [Rhodovastum atsumiense]KAA5608699.1 peptidylprolyl isomerase [Rhodovastum atsumiense]CAH2599113.1 Survival protein SurA precursor (Peptidyl-prolyl cis-trans isomerase SurA) [Rhodovastum atsumiense]